MNNTLDNQGQIWPEIDVGKYFLEQFLTSNKNIFNKFGIRDFITWAGYLKQTLIK